MPRALVNSGSRARIRRASSRAAASRSPWSGQVGEAEFRQAALPRAEDLAAAAQAQILLGDAEAVLGLAHDREPRLRAVSPSGGGVEQQAGGRPVAAPDPAAQLVKLGEAEALGVLDHHDRRVRARRRRPRSPSSRPGCDAAPAAKCAIAASFSGPFMRPCTRPTSLAEAPLQVRRSAPPRRPGRALRTPRPADRPSRPCAPVSTRAAQRRRRPRRCAIERQRAGVDRLAARPASRSAATTSMSP